MKLSLLLLIIFTFMSTVLIVLTTSDDHDHAHSHKDTYNGHEHHHEHEHETPFSYSNSIKYLSHQIKSYIIPNTHIPLSTNQLAFLATAYISLLPILILLPIPVGKGNKDSLILQVLLAFAAGGLLGDAFLHLIPHALSPHSHGENTNSHVHHHEHNHEDTHDHSREIIMGMCILLGLVAFFLIEKTIIQLQGGHSHAHSSHTSETSHKPLKETEADQKDKTVGNEDNSTVRKRKNADKTQTNDNIPDSVPKSKTTQQSHKKKTSAYLNLIADFSHNFTDGLAIGASFLISPNVGLMTAITIFFHEIPHEIGDFAVLLQSGFSKPKAMMMQFVTAIGAFLGTASGLMAEKLFSSATGYILSFTAGGFIYIACVSILPEMLVSRSKLQSFFEIVALAIGILMMAFIGLLE